MRKKLELSSTYTTLTIKMACMMPYSATFEWQFRNVTNDLVFDDGLLLIDQSDAEVFLATTNRSHSFL